MARTDIVTFVKAFQDSGSRQEVADKLEVTYGSIVSREKTLRKHGVNLKVMPKQPRGIQINANALNDLIAQIDGPSSESEVSDYADTAEAEVSEVVEG